jgi:hypothetical protein
MDRNSDSRRVFLSDSELAKRSAPGRLPVRGAKAAPGRGDAKYMQIGSGSPAAMAGQAEHEARRAKPELVAKRERAGK